MKSNNRKKSDIKILITSWHQRLESLKSELQSQNTSETKIHITILDKERFSDIDLSAFSCVILYTGAYSASDAKQHSLETLLAYSNPTTTRLIITDTDKEAEAAHELFREHTVIVSIESFYIRLIAQTVRQKKLAEVYEELLTFAGNEMYTVPAVRLAGIPFSKALRFYENACIAGIVSDGVIRLNPPMNTVIQQTDQVILIARDLDTLQESPAILPAPDNSIIATKTLATTHPESFLVLGWNSWCPRLLENLSQYTGKDSSIRILTPKSIEPIHIQGLDISIEHVDIHSSAILESIVYEYYENILVVENCSVLDSIRALLSSRGLSNNLVYFDNPAIDTPEVSQIFKLSAQAAFHPVTASIIADLIDPESAEIYLKPVENYVDINKETSFYTIIEAARRMNETAIGFVQYETGKIDINPAKEIKQSFYHFDKIIVLSDKN